MSQPTPQGSTDSAPGAIAPALLFAALAFVLMIPAFRFGYPTGHDSFLHATAWFDVVQHWREGNFFPAWAGRFANGWGQPLYLFYPPLPIDLGGLCLLLAGPYFAPIVFAWTSLTVAGYAAYRFAAVLVPESSARYAGIVYMLAPYLTISLYERNAFSEALGAAVLPIVFYAYVRVQREEASPLRLGAALTLLLLSNIPGTAVMGTVLVVMCAADCIQKRAWWPAIRLALALAMTAALSAFYLVPMFAQRKFVMSHLVATGGQAPENNFELLAGTRLFAHDFFSNMALISTVTAVLLVGFAAAAWRASELRDRATWISASAFALAMMLPVTAFVYKNVPGMRAVNFPWRYLTVASLLLALFVASAMSRSKRSAWMPALVLVAFAGCFYAMWPPSHLGDEMASWGRYSNWRTSELPGVQEWMPITARYNDDGNYGPKELVSAEAAGSCSALKVVVWENEQRLVRFDCKPNSVLVLKTFFYPGWQVRLSDGRPAPVAFNEHGAMLAQVSGLGGLEMRFTWTSDRKLGLAISMLAALGCLGWSFARRRKKTAAAA